MQQQNAELLGIQLNANEADNSTSSNNKIIDREQYKNTFIWMIGIEIGWFAVIGEKRITEIHNTKEEIIEILEEKEWNTIGTVLAALMSKIEDEVIDRMWRRIEDKMNNERRIIPTL